MARVYSGWVVPQSTTMSPSSREAKSPPSPNTTSSTASASGSESRIRLQVAAISVTLSAAPAPLAATSATASPRRSNTDVGKPPQMFAAMRRPIEPRPMNPTFSFNLITPFSFLTPPTQAVPSRRT